MTDTTEGIYYSSGKVGIGSDSPDQNLLLKTDLLLLVVKQINCIALISLVVILKPRSLLGTMEIIFGLCCLTQQLRLNLVTIASSAQNQQRNWSMHYKW